MSDAAEQPRGSRTLRWVVLGLALAVLAAAGLTHALGWREFTCVLSGTSPGSAGAALQGLSYAGLWFAALILAPVLLLALVLHGLLGRLLYR